MAARFLGSRPVQRLASPIGSGKPTPSRLDESRGHWGHASVGAARE